MENNKVKIGQHFIKLLLLYILLLLVFLTLYVVSVLVSDYKLDKDKYSVELTKMEDESKSVLDSMLNSALSITNRVNYSLSFRDPYIQLLSGGELSVKDRTTIIQELRSAYAWCGNTDIEEVVLFLDNSDIALSLPAVLSSLRNPFSMYLFLPLILRPQIYQTYWVWRPLVLLSQTPTSYISLDLGIRVEMIGECCV